MLDFSLVKNLKFIVCFNISILTLLELRVDFEFFFQTVVSYFSQHLADIKYLRDFGSKHDWEICRYQPGERVICTVEQLGDEGGCLVTLPNGVKGLVPAHLCPG